MDVSSKSDCSISSSIRIDRGRKMGVALPRLFVKIIAVLIVIVSLKLSQLINSILMWLTDMLPIPKKENIIAKLIPKRAENIP